MSEALGARAKRPVDKWAAAARLAEEPSLAEALRYYGQHRGICGPGSCVCGLDAAVGLAADYDRVLTDLHGAVVALAREAGVSVDTDG